MGSAITTGLKVICDPYMARVDGEDKDELRDAWCVGEKGKEELEEEMAVPNSPRGCSVRWSAQRVAFLVVQTGMVWRHIQVLSPQPPSIDNHPTLNVDR